MEIDGKNMKEVRRTKDCVILQYDTEEDAFRAYDKGFKRYVTNARVAQE